MSQITKTDALWHNANEIDRMTSDIQNGIIKNVKKVLADDDINFTENLSNSFYGGMDGGFKTVETQNRYSGLVENGTPAGSKINFDALRYWVEEKLGVSPAESTGVTMKIYQKITTQGIPAKKFMKKSIKMFIGMHGKITVNATGKKKKSGRFMKMLKKFGRHIKAINKALKNINRTVKKITKPINKGRR